MKFNFPMAATATILSWSVVDFREAYDRAGALNDVLDSIKWATDYFLKCNAGYNLLYGQVREYICLS